jgi:peptidoglycan/LPS O-acetylase OafA/YrhL
VIAFHFGGPGLRGGFFGADVFYVLSGYLITGLLLGEHARRGRIGLGPFWLRRARRLLPDLVVMLVAVLLVVRFAEPAGLFPDSRMSELSTLFSFSNWWQIAARNNYFVLTGAVSPLTHTWSLAIEEQFYLVWPLVAVVVLRLSRTYALGLRILLGVAVAVRRPAWRRGRTGAGVVGLAVVVVESVLLTGSSSPAHPGRVPGRGTGAVGPDRGSCDSSRRAGDHGPRGDLRAHLAGGPPRCRLGGGGRGRGRGPDGTGPPGHRRAPRPSRATGPRPASAGRRRRPPPVALRARR